MERSLVIEHLSSTAKAKQKIRGNGFESFHHTEMINV
jgi:hypothetical protein